MSGRSRFYAVHIDSTRRFLNPPSRNGCNCCTDIAPVASQGPVCAEFSRFGAQYYWNQSTPVLASASCSSRAVGAVQVSPTFQRGADLQIKATESCRDGAGGSDTSFGCLYEKNGKTQTRGHSRKCQTVTATPAKLVVLPFLIPPTPPSF